MKVVVITATASLTLI